MNRRQRRALARQAAKELVRKDGPVEGRTRGQSKQLLARKIAKDLGDTSQAQGADTPNEQSVAEGRKYGIKRRKSGLYAVRDQGVFRPE